MIINQKKQKLNYMDSTQMKNILQIVLSLIIIQIILMKLKNYLII